MATRALDLTGDLRCLAAGLVALATGVLAFVVLALMAVVLPEVSGAWLLIPSVVMVMGLSAVLAWLVFGQGARRFDPAPLAAQQWQWHPSEH